MSTEELRLIVTGITLGMGNFSISELQKRIERTTSQKVSKIKIARVVNEMHMCGVLYKTSTGYVVLKGRQDFIMS